MPTVNPTPEQLMAAKDRALYRAMAEDSYTPPAEIREALLRQSNEARFGDIEKQLHAQQSEIELLCAERDKALRWGILALGTAVMGMATWIVNLFTAGHIK